LDYILKKTEELVSSLTWHSQNLKRALKKKQNKATNTHTSSLPPPVILTQLLYLRKPVGFVNIY